LYGAEAANFLVVAPTGGTFTSIQAALNSITNATALNPYLIEVAPGVYSESIVMKPYVDIQGSGQGVTKITAHGSTVISSSTVAGAGNAEIRSLTIENTGDQTFAVAVRNDSASPRLTNVTLSASGSSFAYGVINADAAPLLTNVTLSASGNYAYGVSDHRSVPIIRDTTISVTGASNAYGVYGYVDLDGVPYTVTINNSQIASTGGTIYGQLGYTARVAASQLAGGPVSGGAAMLCAGVYDENYVFYASTCP
jgi:pectin methylesterase-like acyl-CoA thioesterase